MKDRELELWEGRLKKALKVDREVAELADADAIESYVDRTSRQREAYSWVHQWGFSQKVAARMMRISQPGVCQLIRAFLAKHPGTEPGPEDWAVKRDALDDQFNYENGFHTPGKTIWPGILISRPIDRDRETE